ncbi:MAG TPA: hypothetical protein VFL15_10805 [Gammaproteobacteria bacterium]|nr:hypothetical protein [Gammaproteobacteria bacterium]
MKSVFRYWATVVFAFGVIELLPCIAQADVKIQRVTHFSEVTGITAHDSTTTDYIHGDKKREENTRKFTGAVLGAWQHFRHEDKGALSVDIYDVGANRHYELDTGEKTYSVEPMYTPPQPGEHQAPEGSSDSDREAQEKDSDTRVTKNEFTVKATGEKKNINGFDTSEYLITWDLETENTKTGEKSRSLMTTDMWTANDSRLAKAHAEEAAYNDAYRKLMHEPANADELRQFGFGTVSVNSADAGEFFDKLKKIKGYPVSTDVTWEVSGSGHKDQDKQERPSESLDNAIGSLFGSHSKEQPKADKHDGMTTVFSSHVEIKSVDTDAVSKSLFAVPDGYKAD